MKLAVALVFLFVTLAAADIWSPCGTPADHLKIGTVTVTPDPPVKGQNLTVNATGTLDESVTAGNLNIVLKYDTFITVINKNYDICSLTNDCPIAAGAYSEAVTEQIPSDAPSGSYTGTVTLTDQNSQQITCISLAFKL